MLATAGPGNVEGGEDFRALLTSREIVNLKNQFERKDSQAIRAQASLLRLLSWTNIIVLAIALLSGAVLAITIYWPDQASTATRWIAGALTILTILGTVLGHFARDGDRLGRWQRLRAEAELARSAQFVRIASAAAAKGPAAALDALSLLRTDLLAAQRDWYEARAERHRKHGRITSLFTGVALLLTATASAAALSASLSPPANVLLLVGVFAAAFTAYAADRESLYRDRTNAELYDLTVGRLDQLLNQAGKVQSEIEAGNPQAVVVFAELVAEELQTEHKQWTANLGATSQLVARLDERLHQARTAAVAEQAQQAVAAVTRRAEQAVNEVAAEAGRAVQDVSAQVGEAVAAGTALAGQAAATGAAVAEQAAAAATLAKGAASMVAGVSLPTTGPELAASLTQWQHILSAASFGLPQPHADRANALLGQLSAAAAPLNSDAPASSAIAAAQTLLGTLQGDNPLSSWFGVVAPKLAGVLGTAFPPLGLALGIAEIGAKLGEAGYRRWVASILQAPFSPGLIEPEAVNSTVAMAALDVSPVFGAAWKPERERNELDVIGAMARQVLADPEQLWAAEAARFGNDRARFDKGVQEMRRALLQGSVAADVADASAALAAGTPSPDEVLSATRALNGSPETAPALQTMVALMHELRTEGPDLPSTAMRLALAGATKQ